MADKYLELPKIRRLRVSVNNSCNLHCKYCHKEGQFTKRKEMPYEQMVGLIGVLNQYGVDELKFTGGEPLLNENIDKLVKYSKDLGIPNVSLTTNGTLLEEKLSNLEAAGLDELSISMDTVNLSTFEKLNNSCNTNSEYLFNKVKKGIDLASKSSIPKVNLDMVLTAYNVGELDSMIIYAKQKQIPLHLIKFRDLRMHDDDLGTPISPIIKKLDEMATKKPDMSSKSPYKKYEVMGVKITFVDGLCPDCEACGEGYAIRLTSDGKLKPCMISEKGEVDILTPYINKDEKTLRHRILQAVALKKLGLVKLLGVTEELKTKSYIPYEP